MPVFTVEVEKAVPLHPRVKRKWDKCGQLSPRSATLENLEVKLQAAEQRREVGLRSEEQCASFSFLNRTLALRKLRSPPTLLICLYNYSALSFLYNSFKSRIAL